MQVMDMDGTGQCRGEWDLRRAEPWRSTLSGNGCRSIGDPAVLRRYRGGLLVAAWSSRGAHVRPMHPSYTLLGMSRRAPARYG